MTLTLDLLCFFSRAGGFRKSGTVQNQDELPRRRQQCQDQVVPGKYLEMSSIF